MWQSEDRICLRLSEEISEGVILFACASAYIDIDRPRQVVLLKGFYYILLSKVARDVPYPNLVCGSSSSPCGHLGRLTVLRANTLLE